MGRQHTRFSSICRLARWAILAALALASGCSDPPITPGPPDPPQITCPPSRTIEGAVGAGQVITYPLAAVTGGAPPVVVACNPPSGSLFPAGATTGTCTAVDSLGRQTACVFTVTVVTVTL